MATGHCSVHGAAATHQCRECRELLCPECVDEGHRLLTCSRCGELAEPILAEAAATAPQLERQLRRAAPYTWGEALLYVFRGQGFWVFGSYLAVLAVLALVRVVPLLGALAGCVMTAFVLAVLFLLPAILFEIVRTTAAGADELPDWPEFFLELGTRLAEIVGLLLTIVLSCLPLVLMLRFGGCSATAMGIHCWVFLAIGWLVAFLIWVPMFGAVARSRSNWVAFRFDLHLEAMGALGSDLWIAAGLSTALVLVGQTLSLVLALAPFVGVILSAAVGMYGWFTAAHLVGVVFRRHHRTLARIYSG